MASFDEATMASPEWDLETFLAKERCPAEGGKRRGKSPRVERGGMGLARAIEGEIIPRLVLARRAAGRDQSSRHSHLVLDAGHAEQLTELLLRQDAAVALAFVETLRSDGVSLGAIYLDLLAPAARRLGELWHEDRCNFFDVTLGLCALHQVLRSLAPATVRGARDAPRNKRVLLVPAPGEQHTFGLIMVGEFFRRAGWDVHFETPETVGDLSRMVKNDWFAVVGMSLGCGVPLKCVAPAILSARRASCNRTLGVLVGGSLVNAQPDLAARVGADATALDGRQAVLQAEGVVRMLAAEH
jgi:MerR family transcriptional regulator, light-induced transcriptional regulator